MMGETQRNAPRVVGTLPHALSVTWVMDLGRGAAPLTGIGKHHDAAEGSDAGQVEAVGRIHLRILKRAKPNVNC